MPWKPPHAVILMILAILETPAIGSESSVQLAEESMTIPTFRLGAPEKNPIFYHGRKYQGAQGRVYPYAMLDRLTDVREDVAYRSVRLENKYLQIAVLPELGGRIFRAVDKTNQYEFFYRQHVIKPALVGMAGAWISGGVEWNIPHHHRVTTFMPVDHRLVENADGSKTLWLGETELRHRMRWLVGLTLRPDSSCLEVATKLINRTPFAHSMLCFANAAVHAGPDYQVVFPPRTQFGVQHAKREFVHWPIGQEVYHKIDRRGVDVSWWKNQPAPVSIFAWNYEDDFVGGYDHGRQAGVCHVADHHLAPGKKFFTWGCGEEGRVWDQVLTETDGPYIELMAGAYSDNQPDYSWIEPYETRVVTEYWYPIRSLGGISNANREAAVHLEITAERAAKIAVNTTSPVRDACVRLLAAGNVVLEKKLAIDPSEPFVAKVALPADVKAEDLRLAVLAGGKELIAYQPPKPSRQATPETVTPPAAPKDVKTAEELYQIGLRLEQFHNPALNPDAYYQEALRRDPEDCRANTALGLRYCKRGMFAEAERRLETAVARTTRRHTSPKDAEALYYLGVARDAQQKHDAADEAFHRASWAYAWRAASFFALAQNAYRKQDFAAALDFFDRSLVTNAQNTKALSLKALVLRKLERFDAAGECIRQAQTIDPLDFWTGNEAVRVAQAKNDATAEKTARRSLESLMRGAVESYLELAADYAACAAWEEATDVLTRFVAAASDKSRIHPMVYYDLAGYSDRGNDASAGNRYRQLAATMSPDYCFPFRLESIDVLEHAIAANPNDARAPYYLGNLLYDLQPKRAVAAWERARSLDGSFATVHRNLGIAYTRLEGDYPKAVASFTAALACDPNDPRLITELDEAAEAAGIPAQQRLAVIEKHRTTAAGRDDSLLRQVLLGVVTGRYDDALSLLAGHHFRRWEGDNGPHALFVEAHLLRGRQHLQSKRFEEAAKDFRAALEFPANFETGRPHHGGEKAAAVHYLLGVTLQALGQSAEAKACFQRAAASCGDLPGMRYHIALAHRKLGDEPAARAIFADLTRLGNESLGQRPRIDFFGIFGTPQPPALQAAEAHYLVALGQLGEGRRTEARQSLEQATRLNPNHLGAQTLLTTANLGE